MDSFQNKLNKFQGVPDNISEHSSFSLKTFFVSKKTTNLNTQQEEQQESLLGSFSTRAGDALGLGNRAEKDWIELSRFQRYTAFIVLMLLAFVCFVSSFMKLITIAINPSSFAVSFTFGSILSLAGFATLKGYKPFFTNAFSLARLPYTIIYFGSLILTLYFGLGSRSYIPTLVSSVIQIFSLFWYFGSYLPGGTAGLGFMSRFGARSVGLPF
ncbi:protein transport protein sft2 [Lobulomyces angularis]|nr:protein transport protein sft2 [Lobulomyces angularis]